MPRGVHLPKGGALTHGQRHACTALGNTDADTHCKCRPGSDDITRTERSSGTIGKADSRGGPNPGPLSKTDSQPKARGFLKTDSYPETRSILKTDSYPETRSSAGPRA